VHHLSRKSWSEEATTVRSPAEMPWLECGVVCDVMTCNKERDINSSKTSDATINSEKKTLHNSFFPASGCASSDVSVRSESI
jgi:hypothetical protein